MKMLVGLLCFLFLLSLLYSLDRQVEELLRIAPESPRLLHEHSYIPDMNESREIKPKEGNGEEKIDVGVRENTTNQRNELSLKKPNFTQILLITFVIIILILYRLRLKGTKQDT